LPVLAGRAFRKGDAGVVVVSEGLARRFWGSATSGVGRRLAMGDPPRGAGLQVVGVVRDIKQGSLRSRTDPALYLPYGRMFGAMQLPNLFVNTAEHSGITLQSIRKELQTQIPSARVAGATTVEEILARNLSREIALSQASAILGLIALGITALGIYGVVRSALSVRRNEFGIRMALGATTRDLSRLLARDVAIVGIAGMVAGVLLGVLGGWYAKTLLFGLAPGDPLTLIATPVITAFVACVAVMLASVRLLALSPAGCLRSD
jgi:ABC-type antimicrobial peptide transport system permease subunit